MVKIYTMPNCGICKMVKTKMRNKNIKYEELSLINNTPPIQIDHAPILQIDSTILTSPREMVNWINAQ